jgi:hypothetical protein
MTLTLDQLQAAFKKADNDGNNLPNNYYPFWRMNDGDSATVRFLPDANKDNPFGFMVEKLMHTLEINGENKSVPCLKMYDDADCPICKVSSEYYKKDDKVNGKKFWRKKQYITQALIIEDPLPADDTTNETHVGKVRFLTLGYQIYNVIKEAFESGELDEVPFAYKGGCDFIIKKSKQGDYSTYAVGSRFARKSSNLTDDQLVVVEDNLGDLSDLLPKNPGLDKVQGMLEAALTGGAFSDNESAPATTTNAPAAVTTTENKEEATESEGSDEADAILEQIRARRREQNS